MIALCSSFVMKRTSLARTYFVLIEACLIKLQKQLFKAFQFFLGTILNP